MKKIIFIIVAILLLFLFIIIGFLGQNQNDSISSVKARKEQGLLQPSPLDPDLLLPDLIILEPEQLYLQFVGDRKKIRFSTSFANIGQGPLELQGDADIERNVTHALQRVYVKDGFFEEFLVGEFVLHPEHDHWHFNDITLFELWSLKDDGQLDEVLATTNKTSFCIQDWEVYNPKQAAEQAYKQCIAGRQGISVGWADVYTAEIEGQELDITGVADGRYAIRLTIDPDNLIREVNDDNNTYTGYVVIEDLLIRKVN